MPCVIRTSCQAASGSAWRSRALITEPRFVVFDEAVSALDVSVQTQVLNVIKDLQERHGFAALFISHDLAATRYVSQRMVVMYAGHLMEIGPAERFYTGPRHPYLRALSISIDPLRYQSFALSGGAEDGSARGVSALAALSAEQQPLPQ